MTKECKRPPVANCHSIWNVVFLHTHYFVVIPYIAFYYYLIYPKERVVPKGMNACTYKGTSC